MSKKLEPKQELKPVDLEEIRSKLAKYHDDIKKYLNGYDATIETSKFAVEKEGEGFSIEVAIKASILPRKKTGRSR